MFVLFEGMDIPPLQAVGWEGVFGFFTLAVLHVIFYYIPAPRSFNNNPRGTVEDAIDGLIQVGQYEQNVNILACYILFI